MSKYQKTMTRNDDGKPVRNRNQHARELWENKDYRLKVEIPKTQKRKKYKPSDILNMDLEELDELEG